ncbi:hypothetical protein C8J57DRAFT_1236693 [Mycena rebaudengoi]|nr:hypothetical protein C8J57DRAFT_1236693 [Mycena rebaudengoi]
MHRLSVVPVDDILALHQPKAHRGAEMRVCDRGVAEVGCGERRRDRMGRRGRDGVQGVGGLEDGSRQGAWRASPRGAAGSDARAAEQGRRAGHVLPSVREWVDWRTHGACAGRRGRARRSRRSVLQALMLVVVTCSSLAGIKTLVVPGPFRPRNAELRACST